MFKSKKRDIVVPQSEHGRLSGKLARLWGNDQFDKPALDFQSFVKGVTFHDRGYGLMDNLAIGDVPTDIWLGIQEKGIKATIDDPIANVVSLFHIRRLLGYNPSQAHLDLAEQHIQQSLSQTDLKPEVFEWADKITAWCDKVAFDFSFETKMHTDTSVFARLNSQEETLVDYQILDAGVIQISPWPLSVDNYEGFIIGYELEGYPQRLEPVLLSFTFKKG